jgi:hypothetical protein
LEHLTMTTNQVREMLIEDGYTEERTIPARGTMPALTFSYRPALPQQAYRYYRAQGLATSGDELLALVVGLICQHLVSWNVTRRVANSDEREPVPVDQQSLQRALPRINQRLLDQMASSILGYGVDQQAADLGN